MGYLWRSSFFFSSSGMWNTASVGRTRREGSGWARPRGGTDTKGGEGGALKCAVK